METILADIIFEWNEALFLYEVQKFRGNHKSQNTSTSTVNLVKKNPRISSEERQKIQRKIMTPESSDRKQTPEMAKRMDKSQLPKDESPDKTQRYDTQIITKVVRDYLTPSAKEKGLWLWDSSLPLNLASTSECQQLQLRSGTHPFFNNTELRCADNHHLGRITARDLVTMLFNLMCNSVLKSTEEFCCS